MPIGSHSVAATFQSRMNKVLQPLAAFDFAYIDDIIVFSQTWEERLTHVWAVLEQLCEYDLTANPNKCHIGWQQVNYLGCVVRKGQLRIQPDKMQSLQQACQPVNKKDLQHFLGLASYYYRHFIPRFTARGGVCYKVTMEKTALKD